jgi:hypothetical protein
MKSQDAQSTGAQVTSAFHQLAAAASGCGSGSPNIGSANEVDANVSELMTPTIRTRIDNFMH